MEPAFAGIGAVWHIASSAVFLRLLDANPGANSERKTIMKVRNSTHSIEQTVPARRTVARASVVTAFAAIIFLAMWSPSSAEVAVGANESPGVVFGSAFLVGGSEHDVQTKEADQLARDYSEWLRAAHGRAAATTEEQPLPSQF